MHLFYFFIKNQIINLNKRSVSFKDIFKSTKNDDVDFKNSPIDKDIIFKNQPDMIKEIK